MTLLERALAALAKDLDAGGARYALVGGFALSVRAEPRTTRAVDLAIAVESDAEAEKLVRFLSEARGYAVGESLEHEPTGRLSTQRLVASVSDETRSRPVTVDLLFASSGIEHEIVAEADPLEILPDLVMPVCKTGHLLALKILAGRPQDLADAAKLLDYSDRNELSRARQAAELIERRGFARGRSLTASLERFVRDHGPALQA